MFCNDIYQTKYDRYEHIKASHNEYCCLYCKEWYADNNELEQHIRYAHADKRMEVVKIHIPIETQSNISKTLSIYFSRNLAFVTPVEQVSRAKSFMITIAALSM
jgi:hypothetical protein